MTDEHYKVSFQMALKELSELMSEREELDNRREELDAKIIQLRQGVLGLAGLCGVNSLQLTIERPELFPDLISYDLGLTDAIRKAMQAERVFLSPIEIRKRLHTMGYDIKKHKNILASIHVSLKRLAESDEVETGNRESKVVYRWGSPNVNRLNER